MTQEQNNRINELFQKALKALDEKIADANSNSDPKSLLNELETLLIENMNE